ncbi:hypothetical protein VM1G_11727 [Cytospora mali]|uniref:Uncharacterized protein n=1 Tax=Cytospora mali TaxID=578113 RepID=A0A194W466_CYTMA|nr:hypothetical protein VM1G_11727 [Valsa mali]
MSEQKVKRDYDTSSYAVSTTVVPVSETTPEETITDELSTVPERKEGYEGRVFPRLEVVNNNPLRFEAYWEGVKLKWADILQIKNNGFMDFLNNAEERF